MTRRKITTDQLFATRQSNAASY
ncbi:hypothetical protein ACNKHQ_25210 [Shigella flexneri]